MRAFGATKSLVAIVVLTTPVAPAQIVTNWIAYNDHRPGPVTPPHSPVQNSWGTHVRATGYDMGAPNNTVAVNLTNFLDGQQVPATMTVTRTGDPDNFLTAFPPLTNTPAHRAFFGKVDLSNPGIVGVDAGVPGGIDTTIDYVTFTFNNLNPSKRYLFRGTSCRAGNYGSRWSVATLVASAFIDSHEVGLGSPGVLTSNQYPAELYAGQAAWNSGDNVEGDLIGWDFIAPAINGSFSLVVSQYVGHIPIGTGSAADPNYGWSFGAILLAELEVSPPVIDTQPAAETVVEQNRPFTLSVRASGPALTYQWYKQGSGELSGQTNRTYSVAQAALGDSGDYYVVISNPLGRTTSSLAHVTVNADVTPPSAATVFSYPSFDMNTQVGTLDQVIIDFNEPIEASSATEASQYSVAGIGNPTSVAVTGRQTVLLTLPSALAEDTLYTLAISGARDLVGNATTNAVISFRTWMPVAGAGLLFEAFTTEQGPQLSLLTNNPNYPDSPYLRTNIWAFDTRIVYPDDTQQAYGGRLRGLFIPPTSGDCFFFLRCYDRGEVYLNPNGTDPAGKVLILQEAGGSFPRNWHRFISSPFSLRAGRAYYIEALYQAGFGGVIKVAARLAGTGFPMPADIPITQVDSNALMGAAIIFPLAPRELRTATVIRSGSTIRVTWPDAGFGLERALTVDGPWERIPSATSPYEEAIAGHAFFRLLRP